MKRTLVATQLNLQPVSVCLYNNSDVQAWAWPEAHGLGLAYKGLGLFILLARPSIKAWAWSGLVWAQALAYYQF